MTTHIFSKKTLSAIAVTVLVSACSSTPDRPEPVNYTTAKKCQIGDESLPEWVCTSKAEGYPAVGFGMARAHSQDFSFTRSQALLKARADLAAKLETQLDADIRYVNETIGDQYTQGDVNRQVIRGLVSTTLVGTEVIYTTASKNGDVYLLVGLDFDRYHALLRKMMHAQYEAQFQQASLERAKTLTQEMDAALETWQQKKLAGLLPPPAEQ